MKPARHDLCEIYIYYILFIHVVYRRIQTERRFQRLIRIRFILEHGPLFIEKKQASPEVAPHHRCEEILNP